MAVLNPSHVDKVCGIVSYNLYGLNNGRRLLNDLCNDAEVSIIGVQEHWLAPHNVNSLNTMHEDFIEFGVSAMHHKLPSNIYRRRPFGGVGFLWRKSMANNVKNVEQYLVEYCWSALNNCQCLFFVLHV